MDLSARHGLFLLLKNDISANKIAGSLLSRWFQKFNAANGYIVWLTGLNTLFCSTFNGKRKKHIYAV